MVATPASFFSIESIHVSCYKYPISKSSGWGHIENIQLTTVDTTKIRHQGSCQINCLWARCLHLHVGRQFYPAQGHLARPYRKYTSSLFVSGSKMVSSFSEVAILGKAPDLRHFSIHFVSVFINKEHSNIQGSINVLS